MKPANRILFFTTLLVAMFHCMNAQTKCVWIVKTQDGEQTQKIGVSYSLVKLLGTSEGDFDINGVTIKYETLLKAYKSGSVLRIKDSTGNGETKVYGGKFDRKMNESSEANNRLIIENSDKGGETKISKIHVRSIEAVGILLAMLGSKDIDEDIDKIESVLEPGGVLYARDETKDSTLWIYVN